MADVLIETTPIPNLYVDGGNPARTTWLTPLIGYDFYIAAGGGDALEYRKTTDGGASWGAAVSVPVADTGVFKFALWPDWKTPGDTGTLIHIVTLSTGDDDVIYKTLDTDDDSQTGDVVVDGTAIGGFTPASWDTSTVTITKTIGGNLYIGWWGSAVGGRNGMRRSVDAGATWISRLTMADGNAVDGIQFMPGDEADNQDFYCFYWDYSTDEITIKVHDDSGNTWAETLISAAMDEFSPGFAGRQFTTDIRQSDNHILLFAWDDGGTNASNLKGWDINGSGSITALTNVITGEVNHLAVAMCIDPFTGDIYVGYTGDPGDTWPTNLSMRYKVSTDGGVTWGAAIQLNEDAATDARCIWGSDIHPINGGRWEPTWFLDTLDDVVTSFVNSVSLALPPPPAQPPSPIIASGANQQAGTIVYISPAPESRVFELITPHDPGRFVLNWSGWGTPPIDYITQRGPFQDGVTIKDFFLAPRIIQMLIRHNFKDRDAWWAGRATILNEIRPNRQTTATAVVPGTLRMVETDGTVRDLNVFILEGPRFEPRQVGQWDEWAFQEILRFVAHDPVIFDPTRVDFAFTIVLDTDLVFPITFPITFGSGEIDLTPNITYTGTWSSLPIIVIEGPIEDFRIDNVTTGEKLEFSADVNPGRTVTIDTTEGVKTVTDDLGNNLIGILTSDSDLATFHIAPDPEAPLGANAMRLQGKHPSAATTVEVRYFTRFFGI